MIILTEAEAKAVVDATLSGIDILRPVLIEAGPDAGMYALPDVCAALPLAAKLDLSAKPTRAVDKVAAWPAKTAADLQAYVDPWEARSKAQIEEVVQPDPEAPTKKG